MFHVNHVIAHCQVAEVGQERRGLGALPRLPGRAGLGIIEEIVGAEEDQLRLGQFHPCRDIAVDQRGRRALVVEVGGLLTDAGGLGARAQTVGHLVLVEEIGQAFQLAHGACREHHSLGGI